MAERDGEQQGRKDKQHEQGELQASRKPRWTKKTVGVIRLRLVDWRRADMEAPSEEETKRAVEFVRRMNRAPQVEFERWANEALDRSHRHYVERRKRRR